MNDSMIVAYQLRSWSWVSIGNTDSMGGKCLKRNLIAWVKCGSVLLNLYDQLSCRLLFQHHVCSPESMMSLFLLNGHRKSKALYLSAFVYSAVQP